MEALNKLMQPLNDSLEKIEKLKAATTPDTLLGTDLSKTLEEVENELKGFILKVVVSQKQPSGKVLEKSYDYELKDDGKRKFKSANCLTDVEGIKKLLDHVEWIQKQNADILNKAIAKVEYIKKKYEDQEYTITILTGKKLPDGIPMAKKEKRKISLSSDSELEEENQRYVLYPIYSDDSEMLTIGPNGTQIHQKDYQCEEWKDGEEATKALCNVIFGQNILATHTLSGNQSPAFRERNLPDKKQLDPNKINDIIFIVCCLFNISHQMVRKTITNKCASASQTTKRIAAKKLSI